MTDIRVENTLQKVISPPTGVEGVCVCVCVSREMQKVKSLKFELTVYLFDRFVRFCRIEVNDTLKSPVLWVPFVDHRFYLWQTRPTKVKILHVSNLLRLFLTFLFGVFDHLYNLILSPQIFKTKNSTFIVIISFISSSQTLYYLGYPYLLLSSFFSFCEPTGFRIVFVSHPEPKHLLYPCVSPAPFK